jgi:hypothetical protein
MQKAFASKPLMETEVAARCSLKCCDCPRKRLLCDHSFNIVKNYCGNPYLIINGITYKKAEGSNEQ